MKLAYGTALAAVITTPAFAGSLTTPAPEPAIIPPAPVVALPVTGDWTGFYGGAQLGYGDISSDPAGADGDGVIGGLIAGYDYDFGQFVLGGGIDYDFTDIDLGGISADNVLRLKARGGYDFGQTLLYATGGWAQVDTDVLGDDDGYFIGAGLDYQLSPTITVGGELLYHVFDDFAGSGTDLDATTVQARLGFRF